MKQLCDARLEPKDTTNVHRCRYQQHSTETKHECACGKRWMSPDSYGIVTASDKKSS